MSKEEHEYNIAQKAQLANAKTLQLARLQDSFIEQLREDIVKQDLTAIDEMFFQILKIDGAINHLIEYLPEEEQIKYLNLIVETEL
jgi:hypothetical protein